MTLQEFRRGARVVHPCLLPLLCGTIVRVKALTGIIKTVPGIRAFPVFKDNTTVKDQFDLAFTGFLSVFRIDLPITNPEIKLPVNWLRRAWSFLALAMHSDRNGHQDKHVSSHNWFFLRQKKTWNR